MANLVCYKLTVQKI